MTSFAPFISNAAEMAEASLPPGSSIELATQRFQKQIDQAAEQGGGEVRVPGGKYLIAQLELRSGVTLFLEEGAEFLGSKNPEDYGDSEWKGAVIRGHQVSDVAILGSGVIDGNDSRRTDGEEGFRGYHSIHITNSWKVRIEGITLKNSGNYAILCSGSNDMKFKDLAFRGGHDGVHIQQCRDVIIDGCDFRTGDDCVAGTDNQDVLITNSYFNTACNAFRLGALRMIVRGSTFQGPGEFPHLVSVVKGKPRHNMVAAFVHFSPRDRNPQLPSDEWLIEDCTMDSLAAVYRYDHVEGTWQTGQPALNIEFRNISATNVTDGFQLLGDAKRQLNLLLENVSVELNHESANRAVICIQQFGSLVLKSTDLKNDGTVPVLEARNGKRLTIDSSNKWTLTEGSSIVENVEQVD